MMQVFRYGIDITRHHLKGIYVVALGKARSKATDEERTSSKRNVQVICTSREGSAEECEDWNMEEEDSNASSPKNSLITLSYKGQQTTFRPWDPSRCPLAASIHNRLIHFPIQPNSNVFAIFWSLNSLSHISDTLGPSGNLIAVLSHDTPLKPETLHRFIMRHKNTTVIFEDIKEASLERYTRLLSLPDDSRWAFLMALHPRLGANSPARLLKPEAEKICKIIFDFLVCTTPSQIKSLVMWQGQDESQEEETTVAIFDQALKHINILQHWRKPKPTKPKMEKSSEGESGQEKDNERIWVIMDMRTKLIVSRNLDFKLVNEMAKIGLLAKEQLALTPWFPDRSLLLCRYAVSRDERQAGQASASGAEDKERGKETRTQKIQRPPKAASMQVPSFIPKTPVREEDMQVGQASATSGTEDKERKKEANRPQKVQRPPSAVSMPVPSFGSRTREDKELSASMSRFQPPEAPSIQMMQDGGQDFQAKGKYKRPNRADYAPPGLGNSQAAQPNQPWMASEEAQLLSSLQARHAQAQQAEQAQQSGPSRLQHWAGPPGLQSLRGFPDQALPTAAAQQAQWQAQAQMFPMNMGHPPGCGGCQGCHGSGCGKGGQLNQLPFPFEDQLGGGYMPLNL